MGKPEKLFEDITQFMEQSRSLLGQGALMELAGLEKQVQGLCEQVLALSQDERLKYADRLQGLLKELGELGQTLAVARDKLGDEAMSLTQQKKAHTAYRTAEASDNYGKDEE